MVQMIAPGMRWLLAWALASTIALFVVGACSAPLSVGPHLGRYAIVSVNGQVHRLDTATGEIRVFILGPKDQTVELLGGPFKFIEIGILRPGGKE